MRDGHLLILITGNQNDNRWPKKVLALAIPYGWLQFKFGLLTCLQTASAASSNTSNTFLFLGPLLLAAFAAFCCAVRAAHSFLSHFISSKSSSEAVAVTKQRVAEAIPGFIYALVWGLNVLYTPITLPSLYYCNNLNIYTPITLPSLYYCNIWSGTRPSPSPCCQSSCAPKTRPTGSFTSTLQLYTRQSPYFTLLL